MNNYLEKFEGAKRNIQWFCGVGIICAIIFIIVPSANLNPLYTIVLFLSLIYIFGSFAIGIRFFFKKTGLIPLTFYTFGLFVIIGILLGVFISPFVLVKSINTLRSKS